MLVLICCALVSFSEKGVNCVRRLETPDKFPSGDNKSVSYHISYCWNIGSTLECSQKVMLKWLQVALGMTLRVSFFLFFFKHPHSVLLLRDSLSSP